MTDPREVFNATVAFGTRAAKLGLEPGFRFTAIEVESDRPDEAWMFIPALVSIRQVSGGLQGRWRLGAQG